MKIFEEIESEVQCYARSFPRVFNIPCNSPVRAPCTEVPGPPFPAVAFSTTWNYIQCMQRLSADQQHALPPGLLLAALHATASLM